MARKTKRAADAAPEDGLNTPSRPSFTHTDVANGKPVGEVISPGEQPFAGLTYDQVIDSLVENINEIFVNSECTLADAKVALDMFKDQLLQMTALAEGPRAAQELAFKWMQGCLPYIFNPELEEDPRGSFKSILDSVRESLEGKQ